MSQYWKLLLIAIVIGVFFAVADSIFGKEVRTASFFDCMLMSFLILWCRQVDRRKRGDQ